MWRKLIEQQLRAAIAKVEYEKPGNYLTAEAIKEGTFRNGAVLSIFDTAQRAINDAMTCIIAATQDVPAAKCPTKQELERKFTDLLCRCDSDIDDDASDMADWVLEKVGKCTAPAPTSVTFAGFTKIATDAAVAECKRRGRDSVIEGIVDGNNKWLTVGIITAIATEMYKLFDAHSVLAMPPSLEEVKTILKAAIAEKWLEAGTFSISSVNSLRDDSASETTSFGRSTSAGCHLAAVQLLEKYWGVTQTITEEMVRGTLYKLNSASLTDSERAAATALIAKYLDQCSAK